MLVDEAKIIEKTVSFTKNVYKMGIVLECSTFNHL